MNFHVFDTYVKSKDGHTIHFDIVTDKNDTKNAIDFAKEWLRTIGEESAKITVDECKFCHTQSVSEDIEIEIMTNGYFVAKIEGCPK